MMNTTFNYTTPVAKYDDFIGRRALVSKIYSRIGASRPQSVSIVGDIKIGKSSLLWFLAQEKTKLSFLKNPDEYLYLTLPCRTGKEINLNNFTTRLFELSKPYSDISEEPGEIKQRYNYFKHLVEHLHQQGKKIILFLDDFNLITQNVAFPLEFFSFLRSLANNYNLAYVTSSYEDLQKLCVSKDIEESPFFNIFTNMSLRGFTLEDLSPLYDHSGNIKKEDFDRILSMTGPSPYPLLMASQFWLELNSMNEDTHAVRFENLKKRLQTDLYDYHLTLWKYLDDTQKEILESVVAGVYIQPAQEYLLRDLEKKDYITQNNNNSKISSSLFRNFITRNSNIKISADNNPQGSYLRLSQYFRQLFFRRGRA